MKKKLIIWGGWWGKDTPLTIDNINSFASICAYFLTKHLSQFYEMVNIYDFYSAERILEESDAVATLSTYQCGFSRMQEKGRKREFDKIKAGFHGKLCSIVDDIYRTRYSEDILFTIRPPRSGINFVMKKLLNRNIVIERCGWPAEPGFCFPEPIGDDDKEINIFVDHSWYKKGLDCSRLYFEAFRDTQKRYPNINFNIYRQNNEGVVKWDLKGEFNESAYLRTSKVLYREILKFYRMCHIFCVTHPESAGLAAIEAAMCGAKLYVPSFFTRSFISKELLRDGAEHASVNMTKKSILQALESDIAKGLDREKHRGNLLHTNTWKSAAAKIHEVLSKEA